MIVKQVSMHSVKKSDFAGLTKYITEGQNKNERVGDVTVTNCQSDQSEIAIIEVLNTQAQNTRSTADKTYHLIVSFRAGEQPDDAALKAIEARICDGLGFGDHQRISAVHHDTDNLHIHIAINKIHPVRYTIKEPYNAYHTLGQLCDKLEREFGLEKDSHKAQKQGAENRAADMEHHAGVESLLGWIQRECADQIKNAQSWSALHEVMHRNGLALRERGNGLVITDGAGLGVKASSVARDLSKSRLEQRLGAFEAMPTLATPTTPAADAQTQPMRSPPVAKIGSKPPPRSQNRLHELSQLDVMQIDNGRRYEKKPVRSRVNTVELYARYKSQQQNVSSSRSVEWAKAIARKNRLIEDAKRNGRLKRAAIKLIKGAGLGQKVIYASTSKTLTDEIQSVNKQYLKERQEIYEKYQRLAWGDWLRAQATGGDKEALGALRAREVAGGLKGNTVAGKGSCKPAQSDPKQDSITKKGTIIYCVGPTALRDDGEKLSVSCEASQEGLQTALRMAMARYGERITVNGTAAFKEQIAQAAAAAKLPIIFDDPGLERRRIDLMQPTTTKEYTNEPENSGRVDRRSDGGPGLTAVRNARTVRTTTERTRPADARPTRPWQAHPRKPDIGRVGRKPPPQGQNRLRGLSELGVVLIASRSEVLLPGHVSGHVEQQGTKPDNGMRRDIFGAGGLATGLAAADKYITEREAKRSIIFDIQKHARYNYRNDEVAAFAGMRQIEGQVLALLKQGEEITVLPVDEATARRLKRLTIGDEVRVTSKGAIQTKGRSR